MIRVLVLRYNLWEQRPPIIWLTGWINSTVYHNQFFHEFYLLVLFKSYDLPTMSRETLKRKWENQICRELSFSETKPGIGLSAWHKFGTVQHGSGMKEKLGQ